MRPRPPFRCPATSRHSWRAAPSWGETRAGRVAGQQSGSWGKSRVIAVARGGDPALESHRRSNVPGVCVSAEYVAFGAQGPTDGNGSRAPGTLAHFWHFIAPSRGRARAAEERWFGGHRTIRRATGRAQQTTPGAEGPGRADGEASRCAGVQADSKLVKARGVYRGLSVLSADGDLSAGMGALQLDAHGVHSGDLCMHVRLRRPFIEYVSVHASVPIKGTSITSRREACLQLQRPIPRPHPP